MQNTRADVGRVLMVVVATAMHHVRVPLASQGKEEQSKDALREKDAVTVMG